MHADCQIVEVTTRDPEGTAYNFASHTRMPLLVKLSRIPFRTLREDPSDATTASHQLMVRAGLICQVTSGVYTYSPLGLKVLKRVEAIVREEMDRTGAAEMLMPVVQPATLWKASNRWDKYDSILLRFQDRNGRDFCLGPTHEEVCLDAIRHLAPTYRPYPFCVYQIQTKFRDEFRPRFGLMRAREFCMKDAYSFHLDQETLNDTYADMQEAYKRILTRCGLDYRMVHADSGDIGGEHSHEFHVLADSGEDGLCYTDDGSYAANVERASALLSPEPTEAPLPLTLTETPNATTIDALVSGFDVAINKTVKTMIVKRSDGGLAALVLAGEDRLNDIKAGHLDGIAAPIELAPEHEVKAAIGAGFGSLGPKDLPMPLFVDKRAAKRTNFVAGANQDGYHLFHLNWNRDVPLTDEQIVDIRLVREGDLAPTGEPLQFCRGIEVGHVFQLGTVYSSAMKLRVDGPQGRTTPLMGCYGFGVSRLVAAAIEQKHDDKGIIWPTELAPADVWITCLDKPGSDAHTLALSLYDQLRQTHLTCLFDDRVLSPGVKLADSELLGVPHVVVVGSRGLARGEIELRRRGQSSSSLPADDTTAAAIQAAVAASSTD